jgi:hypothetical protein
MATWVSPPGSGDAVDAEPLAAPPARLRPGRVWYLVALAVIVAGPAWLLAGLAALNGQIDSFQRVALPGNGEITLTHSGRYVIYYEGPGAAAGNAPALTVRLRALSASAAVQGITPSDSFSFSFGSHADTAVLNLKIAHPGRFLLQARAPAAPAGSRLAVGSSVGGSLARIVVPFIALIVVGVCGVVAVAFIRGSRGSRGRRLALVGFASQYGMQYSEDDPYGLPAHDFGLLREGNRRGCQNVLSGRWEDLPVKEADYWYGTGNSFSDKGYRRDFSIVIADLAVTMPNISVVPYALLGEKQLVTWHVGRRPGSHGIRFGSPDFDRKFKVTASDKEFAARLIDPAMIQWLLSTGGQFGFVIQGSELLVSCDQLPATGLVPLFGAAKSFTDHIPQLVWADYSTGQQTPATAETPGEPPAQADGPKSTS